MSPRRLLRRSLTIPGITAIWALFVVFAVPAVAVLAVMDLFARRRFALTRMYLMSLVYSTCQVVGIAWSTWVWVTSRRRSAEENVVHYYNIENWWASFQFRAIVRIFRMKLEVTGEEVLTPGPIVLLTNHVSVVDNVIPAVFAGKVAGLRLRWVLNRSLLRDPCIDLVGNRLPNCFVRGGTDDSAGEIGRIRQLARDLGPDDGIVIFPEGTLYSPRKREHIIRRLRERGDTRLLAEAERLRSTLPPRLGGNLALLQETAGADVVFCAHAGLEDALNKASILGGGLIGRPLKINFRRIARATMPEDEAGLTRWLLDEWAKLDAWVSSEAGAAAEINPR
jgi:1-acyl-sn-glycerol-3-phosphate acyltransferase